MLCYTQQIMEYVLMNNTTNRTLIGVNLVYQRNYYMIYGYYLEKIVFYQEQRHQTRLELIEIVL